MATKGITRRRGEIMVDKYESRIGVKISNDELKAYITIYNKDNNAALTKEEILEALKAENIVYGLKLDVFNDLIQNPVYNEAICIAEGTPAVNGQNGSINYLFNTNIDAKPTMQEDGRINYRELNLIQSVSEGQVLCTLNPPVQGIPGKTVRNRVISAVNGRAALLPRGKNVSVGPDGKSLVANFSGEVELQENGLISVYANHEVPADVDNTTGNINFVGNVIVRGNVLSGFSVEAGGNVEVYGVVEGATIKAGGNIILHRGMQGMGKGMLISGGNIVARYIEYSNIEAKSIQSEAIMHSNVKCTNKLELTGKKGLLVGGTCRAGSLISAKIIGSQMATATELEVGTDPTIRERLKKAKEELQNMNSDIFKADQAITILKKLECSGTLTCDKKEILQKSVRTKILLYSKLEETKQEIIALEEKLQHESAGKIKAAGYIYPGVRVAIGSCMMYVKEVLQHCTLYRDGADVRVGAYER